MRNLVAEKAILGALLTSRQDYWRVADVLRAEHFDLPLHRQIFAATKNKFMKQVMEAILDDRRAVLFDGRDTDKPTPDPVRQQTYKELRAIVDAIADRNGKRAEKLVSDHLMRILATINIWR